MTNISYSALRTFKECPYKYKLLYEDKLKKFSKTEYTIFGTAIHESAEHKCKDETLNEVDIFTKKFQEEIDELIIKKTESGLPIDTKLIEEMRQQGIKLAPQLLPSLKQQFGNFTLLNTEEEFLETIHTNDKFLFKGYIDLIIKTEDGKIHLS